MLDTCSMKIAQDIKEHPLVYPPFELFERSKVSWAKKSTIVVTSVFLLYQCIFLTFTRNI